MTSPKATPPTAKDILQFFKFQIGLSKDLRDADLGRFGLKDANSVMEFLTTPAGKGLQKEIMEQIAFEQKQKDHALMEQRNHVSLLARLAAFFTLMSLSRKARAKDELNKMIAEYHEFIREHSKVSPPPIPTKQGLSKPLSMDLTVPLQKLNLKELELLKDQLLRVDEKYQSYEKSLAAIDESPLHQSKLSAQELASINQRLAQNIGQTQNEITALQNQLKGKTDPLAQALATQKVADLEYKLGIMQIEKDAIHQQFQHGMHYNRNGEPCGFWDADVMVPAQKQVIKDEQGNYLLVPEGKALNQLNAEERMQFKNDFATEKAQFTAMKINKIDQQIAKFEQSIYADQQLIDAHIENGNDHLAYQVAEQNKARYMQIAALNDYKMVMKGEKMMVDQDNNPVQNMKDAKYVVSNGQRLYTSANGDVYLLQPGQTIDKMNPNDLDKSKRLAIESGAIRTMVNNNHRIEKENNPMFLQNVNNRIESLKKQMTTPKPEPTATKKPQTPTSSAPKNKAPNPGEPEYLSPSPFDIKPPNPFDTKGN